MKYLSLWWMQHAKMIQVVKLPAFAMYFEQASCSL
jgi:hypothetical protein